MRVSEYLIPFFVLVILPMSVFGLVENDVKEKTCSELKGKMDNEPIDLDTKLMETVDQWYVPLWSKLHAYRVTADMLDQDMTEISEDRLGKSCVLFKKGYLISAYGKELTFKMQIDETAINFKAPTKRAKSGKFTFKLTDNQSYILGINCWEDDQISWAVLSTTPTLRFGAKNLVMEYIKALGLKKSLSLEEDYGYGSCKGVKQQIEL